jgi:hypothetical protein
VSKSKDRIMTSPAQVMLDADLALRSAADAFGDDENDESTTALRQAALDFADAWRACEDGKGRP